MNIILIITYLRLFLQSLRHPENKPLISHKEALNINEVLFGYGRRKWRKIDRCAAVHADGLLFGNLISHLF